MKAAPTKKPLIRIAVVESDPLRFAGFRALFDSEPDFELISASLPTSVCSRTSIWWLLGKCQNLFDVMACLKATRPQLRIIVTGYGMDEQTILKAIAAGPRATWMRLHRLLISCKRYGSSAEVRSGFHGECFRCSLNALAIRPDISFQPTKWPYGPRDASFKDAGRRAI